MSGDMCMYTDVPCYDVEYDVNMHAHAHEYVLVCWHTLHVDVFKAFLHTRPDESVISSS